MQGKFFEELEVSDRFISHRRTMTETDIVNFTCLTGLMNPLFTDDEFAIERGFGNRVIPGPLTMSIAIALTDEICYGTVTAVLGMNNVKFTLAVNPGDTLWVKTSVVDKQESRSRPDRGLITLSHHVYNQKEEQVCSFERTLHFLKKG